MRIKFCGAAQEVTGSAHLITLDNGFKILLDCGLYQGYNDDLEDFNETWLFEPSDIDVVILSHAHIDHSGRLPKLVKDGFNGMIYCTHATRSLCTIMLLDSAHIQERDAEYYNKRMAKKGKNFKPREPLYKTEDVQATMQNFIGMAYNHWFYINESIQVQFRDAGHILGSASVTLKIKEGDRTTTFGFTGDIGRPNRPILRDPQPMPECDFVICESTYGDRDHEEAPGEAGHFLQIIKDTCVEKKGKLIIPAFSVGRTQELVYMMDRMEHAGKLPKIPVYVDSPLAVNATMVFGTHPECFDEDLNQYMLVDDNPFGFNTLTYVRKVEVSKELNHIQEPCIIISASGMMNAGRIRHHLFNSIDKKQNTLLIVGYASPQTTGGQLRAGKASIKLFGEVKPVLADIEIMDSFSAHGDRYEMIDFLKNQKPTLEGLYLVHGDLDTQRNFKDLLKSKGFKNILIPSLGQEVEI